MKANLAEPSATPPPGGLGPQIERCVAVVGAGHRAGCFLESLATVAHHTAGIVGLCDTNPVRLDHYRRKLAEDWSYSHAVPVFGADEFERMIERTHPSDVLVCTPDHLHAEYVCRALEAGSDVIVEKPLAVDAHGCNQILETAARTGRRVRVAFNCRFMPVAIRVKELLDSGAIGEVISGSLDYMIGAAHGATYFARWHSRKDRSGGLLVHKASHHFDLIHWWLDAIPESVFAAGRRGFFGAENRHKHGITNEAAHYLGEDTGNDPFNSVFNDSVTHRDLYLRGADHDGYRGDRSVWRREDIDIEDAAAVTLRLRGGVLVTYTLNAFCPFAGFHAVFNGVRGRLEARTEFDARLQPLDEQHAPVLPDAARSITLRDHCVVYPLYGEPYEVEIPTAEGGHSGGDPVMMRELFAVRPVEDTLGRNAGPEQGAASALTGIAANQSLRDHRPVAIDELTSAFRNRVRLSHLT